MTLILRSSRIRSKSFPYRSKLTRCIDGHPMKYEIIGVNKIGWLPVITESLRKNQTYRLRIKVKLKRSLNNSEVRIEIGHINAVC